MTCLVSGCSETAKRRGMCTNHYKAWHAGRPIPGNAVPLPSSVKPWLDRDDDALRQLYAQHPSPHTVPVTEIAEVLGRSPAAIRGRAHSLGIAEPSRSKSHAAVLAIPCPACGKPFKPITKAKDQRVGFCSTACAAAERWERHPHPRGALGIQHSDAAKAATSASSRLMWESMSDEDREIRAERTRQMATNLPMDTRRGHTRSVGGRRADLDDRYFRSNWEANYARWLNWRVAHGDIAAWDYECRTFRFPVSRGVMSYTPDFLVTANDGSCEWHEIKGWMTQRGGTALKRFAKYYPDERLVLIDRPVYQSIAATAKSLCEVWE